MPFKRSLESASEEEICEFYRQGFNLAETSKMAKVCVSTVSKILGKHAVLRRPKGTTRKKPIDAIEDSELAAFKEQWDKLDSTVKGTICENYVKTKLSELGFDVWEPSCQNHRTDLVILDGGVVKRIQVKAGTYDLKVKSFRANFSRHRRGGSRLEYESKDVDFFIVYCPGLPRVTLYIIPASEITKSNRCPRLFPHRDRLLVCSPYTLERFVDAFELLK